MPSAFSRHAAEMTMPFFEQLLSQIARDLNHAPAKLKSVLEDAQTLVKQAERLYIEQVAGSESEDEHA